MPQSMVCFRAGYQANQWNDRFIRETITKMLNPVGLPNTPSLEQTIDWCIMVICQEVFLRAVPEDSAQETYAVGATSSNDKFW